MRKLSGLRRYLGTRAALLYLKDYHQGRINPDSSWDQNMHTLWSYGGDEDDVMKHARFMDSCGSDLFNYQRRNR